ncbi:cyclin-dependent protein kinase [Trypanosoma rangeli]|uniref:Cyclin-dependent protein kinase n=1 Tax=Trypanosoma rangeli TaxID=5698 RepID=A0A422NWT9_TRYRA|nr:cyclin-dependent protein kinase [Trypanosoma rangeli]RNF09921.1 cyclin-dependent protein kinase [Trypanosoma rangeli]|eukprot:RNF09921.1 cyclin-dependent protein kinase [Trypanosoma rangeli]
MGGETGTDGSVKGLNSEVLIATKPLISDFFRHAHQVAMQKLFGQRALNCSPFDLPSPMSQQGLSQSSVSVEHEEMSAASCAAILTSDGPSRLKLFVLSPSVAEPPRYCCKGILAETESLHAKHAVEYEFLVPAIASAIEGVVIAHAKWQRWLTALRALRQKDSEVELGATALQYVPEAADADGNTNDDAAFADAGLSKNAKHFPETSDVPGITFSEYVHRIVEYTYVSPSVLLIACLYIDRLLTHKASLVLTKHNIFKLFAVATRVASKVMDTRTLSNKNFARICGIRNSEMNFLEAHFMRVIELDLYVPPEEFYSYVEDLVTRVPAKPPAPKDTDTCAAGFEPGGNFLFPLARSVSTGSTGSTGYSESKSGREGQKRGLNPLPPVVPPRGRATPGTSPVSTPLKGAAGVMVRNKRAGAELGSKPGGGGAAVATRGAVVPLVSVKNNEKGVFNSFSSSIAMPAPRTSRLRMCTTRNLKSIRSDCNTIDGSMTFNGVTACSERGKVQG